jgi:hypothetical protein
LAGWIKRKSHPPAEDISVNALSLIHPTFYLSYFIFIPKQYDFLFYPKVVLSYRYNISYALLNV